MFRRPPGHISLASAGCFEPPAPQRSPLSVVPATDPQDNYDLGELERNLSALGPVATEEFCNLLASPLGDAEDFRKFLEELAPAGQAMTGSRTTAGAPVLHSDNLGCFPSCQPAEGEDRSVCAEQPAEEQAYTARPAGVESRTKPEGLVWVASSPTLASSASDVTSIERRFSLPEYGTPQGSCQPGSGPALMPEEPSSIAAAVKSRRGRMPARALSSTRRGKLSRQTFPSAPQLPIAMETFQHSVGRAPRGNPQLPKAASVGTDLCLLRDGRPEAAYGSSESLLDSRAASQGSFQEDELRASSCGMTQQMWDPPLRQRLGLCAHSMPQLPNDPGQMRDPGAGPLSTSSSSRCSSRLSGDSMGGESTWDQQQGGFEKGPRLATETSADLETLCLCSPLQQQSCPPAPRHEYRHAVPCPHQALAPVSPFYAPAQRAAPDHALLGMHASFSTEPAVGLPAETACRSTSGPLQAISRPGPGMLPTPASKPWALRIRSGRDPMPHTADGLERSRSDGLQLLKSKAAEAMQVCQCRAVMPREVKYGQCCTAQMQLPSQASADHCMGEPAWDPRYQHMPMPAAQPRHVRFAEEQPQPTLFPQPQLARPHASAPDLVTAASVRFSTGPSGPILDHPASPMVGGVAGCPMPVIPMPMGSTCRLPAGRAMSAPAAQGFMQALLAEAERGHPEGMAPPHSPQPSLYHQHPTSQGQHSLTGSSLGSWQLPALQGVRFGSSVGPAATARPQGSATSAVSGVTWQSPPLAQGWRPGSRNACDLDHVSPEPALKRAKSSGSSDGPVSLWQAVRPDKGLIHEVQDLVNTRLDAPTQQHLKHALYRFATSAALNNGQAKRGFGHGCNKKKNLLVDMAVATLLYNRY